jgi:hypothetical protein
MQLAKCRMKNNIMQIQSRLRANNDGGAENITHLDLSVG